MARSIELAFDVLEAIASSKRPLSQGQICTQLGVAKSSLSGTMKFLRERGYVQAVTDGGLQIGSRVLDLSHAYLAEQNLAKIGSEILVEVVDGIRESATLAILDDDRALVVAQKSCRQPLAYTMMIGTRPHLHASASGKILLAFSPIRDVLLSNLSLEKVASQTLQDAEKLRDDLDNVIRLGFAVSDNEALDGVLAIAVPVNVNGEIIAALSVAGPDFRLGRTRRETVVDELKKSAKKIAVAVGG
jgi:DNA-binding IclR family transcriptional regulator